MLAGKIEPLRLRVDEASCLVSEGPRNTRKSRKRIEVVHHETRERHENEVPSELDHGALGFIQRIKD